MRTPSPPPSDAVELAGWLVQIVDLDEGAVLRGNVHKETLKRDARRKKQLLQLGRRRLGVRRHFALLLPPPAMLDLTPVAPATKPAAITE
jgi:hypothetical protein